MDLYELISKRLFSRIRSIGHMGMVIVKVSITSRPRPGRMSWAETNN